jgi:hypothetical protein
MSDTDGSLVPSRTAFSLLVARKAGFVVTRGRLVWSWIRASEAIKPDRQSKKELCNYNESAEPDQSQPRGVSGSMMGPRTVFFSRPD